MLPESGLFSQNEPGQSRSDKPDWNQFSKALLNASPSGIAVLDTDLKVIISNKNAQNGLKLFPGSLLCATLPALEEPAKAVLATGQAALDEIVVKQNDLSYSV